MPGLPFFGTVSAAEVIPAAPSAPNPSRVSQIMKHGFPGFDNIRSYSDYVLSYDRRNKTAHWVFEHLTPASIRRADGVDRAQCEFSEDKSVHPYFRSTNADYKKSGYDRGHLAAAGNHQSHQQHVNDTFFLSNMAPQVGVGFNRNMWNSLERYVRSLVKTSANVYVCTGPLYLPRQEADGKRYVRYEVIGTNAVAVPTHFYKVVVYETDGGKSLSMEAYVLPNRAIDDSTPLKSFLVPPESIERAAGLLFFDRLSRDQLKSINGKKV